MSFLLCPLVLYLWVLLNQQSLLLFGGRFPVCLGCSCSLLLGHIFAVISDLLTQVFSEGMFCGGLCYGEGMVSGTIHSVNLAVPG